MEKSDYIDIINQRWVPADMDTATSFLSPYDIISAIKEVFPQEKMTVDDCRDMMQYAGFRLVCPPGTAGIQFKFAVREKKLQI